MHLKIGYCPICDKVIEVYSDDITCDCPDCGHHIALHYYIKPTVEDIYAT